MQHWVFPLEGEVALEVEPWVFRDIKAGDLIFWVEGSGEIGFAGKFLEKGDLVDEAAAGAGARGKWILASYGRAKFPIAPDKVPFSLRPDDLDPGDGRSASQVVRRWPHRGTIAARGDTAENLVSLTGGERIFLARTAETVVAWTGAGKLGWVKERLPDPTGSRIWVLGVREEITRRIAADEGSGETWIEVKDDLFEELEEGSRILIREASGEARSGGRVLAKVRREVERGEVGEGGSLKIQHWRLARAIETKKLEGIGKRVGGKSAIESARRVTGQPAQDLLRESRPEDGGPTAWLVRARPVVHLVPHFELPIEQGARVYWREGSKVHGSLGTVVGTSAELVTRSHPYPLVAVHRLTSRRALGEDEAGEMGWRAEPSLRRFRPTSNPAEILPISPEFAALLEACWVLPREGPIAVEVDDESFRAIRVGEAVLRVENRERLDHSAEADLAAGGESVLRVENRERSDHSAEVDLTAGVVLAKEPGHEGMSPLVWVDLTTLGGKLLEKVVARLKSEGQWPPEPPGEVTCEPLAALLEPVFGRLARRGSWAAGQRPADLAACVRILPAGRAGPVVLDLGEKRVSVGSPVLWQESSGEIRSWGIVEAKRVTVSIERKPLDPEEHISAPTRPSTQSVRRAEEVPKSLEARSGQRARWICQGPVAVEVDAESFDDFESGDPVLMAEASDRVALCGFVDAKFEDRQRCMIRMGLGSLSRRQQEQLVAVLGELRIGAYGAALKIEGMRAQRLLDLLAEAAGMDGPDPKWERVWLLPPGPLELEAKPSDDDSYETADLIEWNEEVEERDLVLWQESSGEIRSWGAVVRVQRRLRVGRESLGKVSAETVEEAFEQPQPRQLRDPQEVATFFELTRETARSFEEVFREEMDAVSRLRERRGQAHAIQTAGDVNLQADRAQLAGLAFSGGGIRSATFNLGVLQGLARLGLLRGFDYLSTVSGGGYVGSWLVAWIRRRGRKQVEETLSSEHSAMPAEEREPPAEGDSPIAWLRSYSNFLTPNLGLFSADAWTAGSTYVRNLLLNLIVLTTFLAALLLWPRIFVQASMDLGYWAGGKMLWVALVLQAWGLVFIGRNVAALTDFLDPSAARSTTSGATESNRGLLANDGVRLHVVQPMFLATWAAAVWVWLAQDGFGWRVPLLGTVYEWLSGFEALAWIDHWEWLPWALATAFLYTLSWQFFGIFEESWTLGKLGHALVWMAFPAGFGGGIVLWWLAHLLYAWTSADFARMILWGPPLIAQVVVVTAVLHIGLMGRDFPEDHREWWSRLGAWMEITSIAWIALFSVALYGPAVLVWLKNAGPAAIGGVSLSWLASTIGGIWAARRSGDQTSAYKLPMRVLVIVAPYIFAIGLLALLALAIQASAAALLEFGGPDRGDSFAAILNHHLEATWQNPETTLPWLVLFWLGLNLSSRWLSTRVDVNEFSMHLFYRNRLIRAYLGASNENRRKDPFTGFDPADDTELREILPTPATVDGYDGPYPVFNSTLNLVGGGKLAWQQRRARSFFFTPLHYGFDTRELESDGDSGSDPSEPAQETFAMRCTAAACAGRGITLGTAATVSGAAVNPSMGTYTSTPLAFLLTVFNLRLGLWMGNPKNDGSWRDPGPKEGLKSLLSELFSRTDENAEYVLLSDGGHFENLGIYELVRRRCRFIVACDAEGDPKFAFKGLGEAIRMCRIDFGVEIDIDVERLRPRAETGLSGWHCAYGDIHYPEATAPRGTLLYIKASLTGDEPEDLVNYRATRSGFPHESTGDQWFDESQFESYRRLGHHTAEKVFEVADLENARGRLEPVIVDLRQSWYPPSTAVERSFTRHTAMLLQIFERLRSQPRLRFLIPQVYTELAAWEGGQPVWEVDAAGKRRRKETHPARPEDLSRAEFREGFFLCNSVIQLMENVYVDLSLERESDHPDNYGWMNLFRHWSWSWMFRLTWAVSASTYGSRFQRFCERRLGLDTGRVRAERIGSYDVFAPDKLGPEVEHEHLNADERRLLRALAVAVAGKSLPGHRPTTVWSLRLQIAEASGLSGGAAQPAGGAGGQKALFEYSIGLAMLRGHRPEDPAIESDRGLVFLQVRDHLRNRGLGRRALKHLVRQQRLTLPLLLPDQETFSKISPKLRKAAIEEKLREKLFSVCNELGRQSS